MKNKKRRLICAIIVVAFIVLCGVFIKFFNGNLVYFSTGLGKNTILKVGGESIIRNEALIAMSDAKGQYEELLGSDIWNEEIDGQNFYTYVDDQIKVKLIRVAMLNKLAKERGVVLSRQDEENVKSAAKEYLNGLSSDDKNNIKIDEDSLEEMFTKFAIAKKVYEEIVSEYDIEVSYDDARVIDIQYIVSDSEDEIKDAYNKIKDGTSFFALAKEINDDGEYEIELKRGDMDEEFEKVAFNLATGDMSQIINIGDKYYIIRCTSDNDKTKTEVNKTTILENKQLEKFNEFMNEYESKVYVDFNNKAFNKISVRSCNVFSMNFESVFNSFFNN
ncbi:peptidylprolyl isomerase [Lachnospira multipara]|uniref:peptidylprolyl isomerase n=1 Tax=Lachnospira multipara TaxID=28051 RepID=UPI00047FCDAF|nr:SurA N-terminal domain-containing protein [Lachnospira multipara]